MADTRKTLATILTVTLIAALTACTGNATAGTGSTQEANQASEDENITVVPVEAVNPADATVGIMVDDLNYGHSQEYVDRLRDSLVKADFSSKNIEVKEAKGDAKTQLSDIEACLEEGCSVLIVECVNSSDATSIANMAAESAAAVIFIGTAIDEEEIARWERLGIYATYIDCDHEAQGSLRAEILDALDYDELDGSGDHTIGYVILESGDEEDSKKLSGSQVNADTVAALEENHYKLEEVADVITADTEAEAEEEIAGLLEEHADELEVILCGSDELALGAQQAVFDAGSSLDFSVWVVGIEATPESLESIAASSLFCTLFEDYIAETDEVVKAAGYYIRGIDVDYTILCSYVKVTVNNAREILDVTKWEVEEEPEEGSTEETAEVEE